MAKKDESKKQTRFMIVDGNGDVIPIDQEYSLYHEYATFEEAKDVIDQAIAEDQDIEDGIPVDEVIIVKQTREAVWPEDAEL